MEPLEPWRDDSRMLGSHLTPLVMRNLDRLTATDRRAKTGLAANVGDDAPQPPHLDGKRKWRHGQHAASLRLRVT